MIRLRLALVLATGLFASQVVLSSSSLAQDYPSRPVRVIVPFGAGGPADVTARQIGSILQENFGQPFVVENRTGAGGVIGTLEAAKSPPDGYTLLMMSNTQTANESLVPQRKYELMRDLAPIAPVNYSDLVIVVHPGVAAKTLPTRSRWAITFCAATEVGTTMPKHSNPTKAEPRARPALDAPTGRSSLCEETITPIQHRASASSPPTPNAANNRGSRTSSMTLRAASSPAPSSAW